MESVLRGHFCAMVREDVFKKMALNYNLTGKDPPCEEKGTSVLYRKKKKASAKSLRYERPWNV